MRSTNTLDCCLGILHKLYRMSPLKQQQQSDFLYTHTICEVMHCDQHRQFSYGIRTLWFCCMSKEQHCSVLVFRLASNRNKSYGTYEIILIYLIVRVKTTWPEVVGYHIKLQLLWSQNGRSAVLV